MNQYANLCAQATLTLILLWELDISEKVFKSLVLKF